MAMTIMNNSSTMMTLRELNKNTNNQSKGMKKLASGLKIASAQDDASGYSISERMRARIRGLEQNQQNLQNGMSLVKVGLGGMEKIKESMEHMKELALGAANDSMTNQDRATSQKVLDQLIQNVDDMATGTTFNGIQVLMPDREAEFDRSEPVDFVFVVDISGSMGSYIENVANHVSDFAEHLRSRNVDYRFGVVSYSDVTEDLPSTPGSQIEQRNFGEDISALENHLRYLAGNLGYGGDEPESGLEAIMDADSGALSFPFRENALKHLIVLTDASVHDKDDSKPTTWSGAVSPDEWYSVDEVIDALKKNDVKVTAISNGHEEWNRMVSATGGDSYDIGSNYGESLKSMADKFEYTRKSHLMIQEGTKANDNIRIDVFDHRPRALGLTEKIGEPDIYRTIQITTREAAVESLSKIDRALEKILDRATTYGACVNRMEHSFANVTTANENVISAESTIRDADMAKEMVNYTRANVLSQSAQSMLAQANQNASSVLSLLQ